MTDIVKRLRLLVPSDSSGAAFDAVDEITRLRAEINEAQKREACAFDLSREWEAHCKTAEAQRDSLRAENERLREALRDIIADSYSVYAIGVARAALKEEGDDTV